MGRPAQYRVKQNPKLGTTVESQVSKTARPGAPGFENASKEAAQAESILDNNRVITTECSRRNRPFSWPKVSIGHPSLTTKRGSKLNHLLSKTLPVSRLDSKTRAKISS